MTGKDWQKDGKLYDDIGLLNVLVAAFPESAADVQFIHAVAPTFDLLQQLTAKYHNNSFIKYGAFSPDFPLCLDYATLACADLLRGAILEGMEWRVAFGIAELTKKDGGRHAICWAMTADKGLVFYEPQTKEWFIGAPEYVSTMDNMVLD